MKAEDYGRAAELRDAGCAGLMGWWVSRAEGDPGGHLLRVAPSYGRYTCQMYTPREFAELKASVACSGCLQTPTPPAGAARRTRHARVFWMWAKGPACFWAVHGSMICLLRVTPVID